jgi:hypothetical protein
MRHAARITTALVATVLSAAPALAQKTGGVGLGLAGGYFSPGGSDFEYTDAGVGLEASGRFHLGPSLQLLGGLGLSWHNVTDIDETITVMRVSVEPRYTFPSQGTLTPFIGGRAGWAHGTASYLGTDYTQNGYYFAGAGGLMIRMSPTLSFEVEAMFGTMHLGDAKGGGATVTGSSADGSFLGVQAGVVLQLGGQ